MDIQVLESTAILGGILIQVLFCDSTLYPDSLPQIIEVLKIGD